MPRTLSGRLGLARVQSGSKLDPERRRALDHGARALDRASLPFEGRKEAVSPPGRFAGGAVPTELAERAEAQPDVDLGLLDRDRLALAADDAW
jgi:hypothetical protein